MLVAWLFFCQKWTLNGGFSRYIFWAFSNHWRIKTKTTVTPPPSHPRFPHMLAHHHAAQWLMLPPFISVVSSLFCIWMMRWHICQFLLLTHARLSVGTQKRVWASVEISYTPSSHEGIYHFSENAHLCVYEMLMRVAAAWLCAGEHWRPLFALKATCYVCFSKDEVRHSSLNLDKQRGAGAVSQENTSCPASVCFCFTEKSKKQWWSDSALHSQSMDG